MREVSVIFSTPKKFHFSSWALKTKIFGMGTPFSHACLKIYSTAYDKTVVYEASGSGIRAEKFENWKMKNKVIHEYSFNVPQERKVEIIKYCIDHLGIQYGFRTIAYLFLQDKFGWIIGGGKDGVNSFICSEFAYFMLKEELDKLYSQIQRPLPESMEDLHPRELYEALIEAERELGAMAPTSSLA